jgi:hypothetical protein
MSPDWSAKVEPVPYAKLGDPQSLNLYAYVRNNPILGVDPDGHTGVTGGLAMEAQNASPLDDNLWDKKQPPPPPPPPTDGAQQTNAPAANTPYIAPGTSDARNAILGILGTSNSCSNFFNAAAATLPGNDGSSAAQIFSAVDIRLNPQASPTVGAQTAQGSGKDGPIFVNPSGPFFKSSAIVNFKITQLNVAPGFTGGTLRTQEVILLHELGHKVGAIPSDRNSTSQSNQNTETIIKNCLRELSQ